MAQDLVLQYSNSFNPSTLYISWEEIIKRHGLSAFRADDLKTMNVDDMIKLRNAAKPQ